MFSIGWSEIGLILIVAIVLIRPKDLPQLLTSLGRWIRKGQTLLGTTKRLWHTLLDEAEIEEIRKKAYDQATKIKASINEKN
ncbi:MAG: hypothetical protein HOI80_05980 [Alphaproteobacteria bacterium]|jgi:sec-independent protein translocase protein TatB|nr:hypothetical protein [Alphaproteobacteria bacterium]MBT5389360.1 hypothetical protein [Alphaproteobacteria bacterium]MBT5655025.1 hypothetical protein [Alphaproteobacteria bacterium]